MDQALIPKSFWLKRLHSFMGLWLVLYLFEHLLVNSQAALFFDEGNIFVRMVNSIQELPYLKVVELVFIGVPFLVHGIWGVWVMRRGKLNSLPYERNRAFNWQRITSWLLIIGVLGHVVQMRFLHYPKSENGKYVVQETVVDSFGEATLLTVRETFKQPLWAILYTAFVLFAAFHAFNGLWTASISWGIVVTQRAQRAFLKICYGLMLLVSFFGLLSIWGSYFD